MGRMRRMVAGVLAIGGITGIGSTARAQWPVVAGPGSGYGNGYGGAGGDYVAGGYGGGGGYGGAGYVPQVPGYNPYLPYSPAQQQGYREGRLYYETGIAPNRPLSPAESRGFVAGEVRAANGGWRGW